MDFPTDGLDLSAFELSRSAVSAKGKSAEAKADTKAASTGSGSGGGTASGGDSKATQQQQSGDSKDASAKAAAAAESKQEAAAAAESKGDTKQSQSQQQQAAKGTTIDGHLFDLFGVVHNSGHCHGEPRLRALSALSLLSCMRAPPHPCLAALSIASPCRPHVLTWRERASALRACVRALAASIRNVRDGKWYRIDDTRVEHWDSKQVRSASLAAQPTVTSNF